MEPQNDYSIWAKSVLGNGLQPNTDIMSTWGFHSPWGRKLFNVMRDIEVQYVESLMIELSEVEGCVAEFGVFAGDYLSELVQIIERNELQRMVFGFDSFQGLPHPDPIHDQPWFKMGNYSATLEEVSKRLSVAQRPWIKLYKGWFSESLTAERQKEVGPVAFARLDADLYESTKEVLEFLTPLLIPGSVMAFDDWTYDLDKGETKAFKEWTDEHPNIGFEFLCSTSKRSHIFVRVTSVR